MYAFEKPIRFARDDNANTRVLYIHAVVIVIVARPLASKILLYRYFEVQAVGCHRLCVTLVSDVFIKNTVAQRTSTHILYLCAHRSYYTLLLWLKTNQRRGRNRIIIIY